MTKADRGARIPPTPGSRQRSSTLFGTDTNTVSRKAMYKTRFTAKASKVKRRYMSAAAAEHALAVQQAKADGVVIPDRPTPNFNKEEILARTFKPIPHSDKIPPKSSGKKPRYQGYATRFTPAQVVQMVGAPGKVERVPQFIPKSRNIKPERQEVSVRSDWVWEFLKGVRANQDRIVKVGKTTDLGLGVKSVQVTMEYSDLDLDEIEEGNLYVKDDKGPQRVVLVHTNLHGKHLCGDDSEQDTSGNIKVEQCLVCNRLAAGGPEAIAAHQALLKEV
jgi:hypothetical protein